MASPQPQATRMMPHNHPSLSLGVFSNFTNKRTGAIPAKTLKRHTLLQVCSGELKRRKRFCSLSDQRAPVRLSSAAVPSTQMVPPTGGPQSDHSNPQRGLTGQVSRHKPDHASYVHSHIFLGPLAGHYARRVRSSFSSSPLLFFIFTFPTLKIHTVLPHETA